MSKLTPTTNDQLQAQAQPRSDGHLPPHIVQSHEPLREDQLWERAPMMEPPRLPDAVPPPPEQKANPPEQIQITKAPLKIALVGTAPSSRMLAPYNDPSWKIWACSPGNMNQIPRFDVWVEVHGTNLLWPENSGYAQNYINWMKGMQCPLYMQDQQLCPNAISIPLKELLANFGPYYFTSTFAYMQAMALLAGAEEIAMYGIDMASRDEYIIQRPGAYWFMYQAALRGCKMWAPYESDIMQPPPLYGYSDVGPMGRKLNARRAELAGRLNQMRPQRDTLMRDITYLEGAMEDNDYMLSIQGGAQDNADISYLDTIIQKVRAEKSAPAQASLTSQG